MTSIYRTAYPRFHSNQKWKQKELEDAYTLTEAELGYIKRHIRGEHLKLSFAVLLKIFQQLGYFPSLEKIPKDVIEDVKKQLPFASSSTAFYYEHESTLHRHRLLIYSYLKITRWNKAKDGQNPARQYAIKIAYKAAQTMNYPADIINVVVEELRKNNFELPAFSQLSRLVKHTRATVNRKIFNEIYKQLTPQLLEKLETLLQVKSELHRTSFNDLKLPSKNPTISHFQELIKHHEWLVSFGDFKIYTQNISKIKLQQFAEYAKSLDVSDLKDFSDPKCYSLIVCLIYRRQCLIKDDLAKVFCKTIAKMHKKANEKLG